MKLYFEYKGKVFGQSRPRFRRNGKPYESRKITEYKKAIAEAYKAQCGDCSFGSRPVGVEIHIWRELPRYKARKTHEVFEPDTRKPDADNLAKAVLDALNGIAYADDNQVTSLTIRKQKRFYRGGTGDVLKVWISDEDEA